jgi:hypothetical protein
MLKRLLFFLLLLSTPAWASHIVGGEFELLHISGNIYKLNLILYFDEINGNPGARDGSATARIFRKSDNAPILDVFIPFLRQTDVEYFQPECSSGEIVTDKLLYSTQIVLSPEVFNDPGGYYVAWERCCRNYTITNIFSDNPQLSSNYAGQTFYLEFPPVVKDGKPFVNSSPQLFPPLNDYACPNRPYWVDFAGIDVDGDSLVYSLITPLNTVTAQAIPQGGPHPGPYPSVNWQPGFGLDQITGGMPDLAVSDRGFLTVTPGMQGLFVFAVKCEEFRDGVKIGELIRDFQMLVLDKCPVAEPPEILGKLLTDTSYDYKDNMSVTFSNTVTDENRCIQVQISDPDASRADDNFLENIWIKAIPIDFYSNRDLNEILPEITSAVLIDGSTKEFEICFDRCPFIDGRPYKIGIVAFDDACALPLSDTLRIEVNIEPPPNTPAYFMTGDASVTVKEGDGYQLQIEGRDDDTDTLTFTVLTDGFNPADFGMSFTNTTLIPGSLSTTFNWQTGCDVYNFTERTSFEIKLVLNDLDECDFGDPDILTLNLTVTLPPNTDPVISTDLTNLSILSRINDPIDFNVFGVDSDGDQIELTVIPDGFTLAQYDIVFPDASAPDQVSSHFSWNPTCSNIDLDQREEFAFLFILNDLDKCKFPNFDSLEVSVKLLPPDNRAPNISFINLNHEVNINGSVAELSIDDLLSVDVLATDPDDDLIVLELLSSDSLPANFSFEPVTGQGSVRSTLQWLPECTDLTPELGGRDYIFNFKVADDICYSARADTVQFRVSIQDIQIVLDDFIPANVITPNNDGLNEYFSIPDLPVDNCAGQFQSVRIYNRWGTDVFVTTDPDFKWYAEGVQAGVYYYAIEYTNREFNGPLSVLY